MDIIIPICILKPLGKGSWFRICYSIWSLYGPHLDIIYESDQDSIAMWSTSSKISWSWEVRRKMHICVKIIKTVTLIIISGCRIVCSFEWANALFDRPIRREKSTQVDSFYISGYLLRRNRREIICIMFQNNSIKSPLVSTRFSTFIPRKINRCVNEFFWI